MNFFHHKDLGNHLLQLCPKVVKHPVYINTKHILVCMSMYRKMGARVALVSIVHCLTDLLEMTPCLRKLEDPKTKDVGDQEDNVEE